MTVMKKKGFSILFVLIALFLSNLNLCASPLTDAVKTNDISLVKKLLKDGAKIHEHDNYAFRLAEGKALLKMLNLLLDNVSYMHSTEFDSFLMWAIKCGNYKTIKSFLTKNGIDVHSNRYNALQYSAQEGHYEIVDLLLQNGADVHANNNDALRSAAENGEYRIVKLLIENGADIHAGDDHALIVAAQRGYYKIVKLLLENGANVHAYSDSALRLAAYNDHHEVVALLLTDPYGTLNEKNIQILIENNYSRVDKFINPSKNN